MTILSAINSISPAQAMWGLHLLMPPGKYDIASSGIWDGIITHTSELDIEQQDTTEAQNPLDVKGGDKQKSFSINVQVNKLATGQDPLSVYASWVRDIGKSYPFFIGAVPIDASVYRLQSVNLSFQNADIAPNGAAFRVDIALDFEENTILRVASKGVEENENEDRSTKKKTASNVGASKAAKDAEIKKWQKELFE